MSSKRRSSMSAINDFATTQQIKDAATPEDAVALFLGKPVPSTAPGTQPSTKTVTTKSDVAGEKEEDTQTIEGPSALGLGVNSVYDFVRTFYRSTSGRLERTPIPGGIAVPLGILLLLFLVLLPVNGHTRIMWLWLAITGQAQVGGAPIPPTQLTAAAQPQSTSTSSYNTGSPSVNPNQTGTSTSSSKTVASTTNHAVVSNSKHSTTVVTNTKKTHTTAKSGKGSGPSPASGVADPTSPVSQISYAYLFRSNNGYE